MQLNNRLVLRTSIAALLVIAGVVTKNSLEQMKMADHPIGTPLGIGLFVVGWLYTACALSLYRQEKALIVLSSLAILASVLMMKQYMKRKQSPPLMFPVIFAIAWLVLGFSVSNHLSGNMKYVGLLASACVLASMMVMLPFQRKNNVVDGPGMPLFVIAWVILVFLNSSR